jgi:hypothetical protein
MYAYSVVVHIACMYTCIAYTRTCVYHMHEHSVRIRGYQHAQMSGALAYSYTYTQIYACTMETPEIVLYMHVHTHIPYYRMQKVLVYLLMLFTLWMLGTSNLQASFMMYMCKILISLLMAYVYHVVLGNTLRNLAVQFLAVPLLATCHEGWNWVVYSLVHAGDDQMHNMSSNTLWNIVMRIELIFVLFPVVGFLVPSSDKGKLGKDTQSLVLWFSYSCTTIAIIMIQIVALSKCGNSRTFDLAQAILAFLETSISFKMVEWFPIAVFIIFLVLSLTGSCRFDIVCLLCIAKDLPVKSAITDVVKFVKLLLQLCNINVEYYVKMIYITMLVMLVVGMLVLDCWWCSLCVLLLCLPVAFHCLFSIGFGYI